MALAAALLDPAAYPEPTSTVELVQTHISWVFLTDFYAYKVKKPVDLGFLNFTTLWRRHHYLKAELTLNRRLCPEIYLDVLPIVWRGEQALIGGQGRPADYALKMVRLPQARMMDEVADRGELTPAHLDAIIDRLAPFYEQAASGPHINRFGQPGLIAFNHEENFRSTEALAGVFMEPEAFQAIRTYARNFLATQRPLFRRRIRDGRIRDCHGDLHMRNICLADGVHIFDCIEFNARFRYGDVAADIDFLAMELDFHGFQDLSRYFVSRFAQASRDPELLQALNFYKCYRAYVRGKVQALAAQDEAASPQARDRAGAAARAYFALAGQYARQADV